MTAKSRADDAPFQLPDIEVGNRVVKVAFSTAPGVGVVVSVRLFSDSCRRLLSEGNTGFPTKVMDDLASWWLEGSGARPNDGAVPEEVMAELLTAARSAVEIDVDEECGRSKVLAKIDALELALLAYDRAAAACDLDALKALERGSEIEWKPEEGGAERDGTVLGNEQDHRLLWVRPSDEGGFEPLNVPYRLVRSIKRR